MIDRKERIIMKEQKNRMVNDWDREAERRREEPVLYVEIQKSIHTQSVISYKWHIISEYATLIKTSRLVDKACVTNST